MPHPDFPLEPAVRDPKKLRNTALILVGIMIIGGWFILRAYGTWTMSTAKDDRPAMIYRITKERDLRMVRQDGKIVNLYDLRGRVVLIHAISTSNPEGCKNSLGVMQRAAKHFAANQEVALVSLLVDPLPADQAIPSLTGIAQQHGMQLPQWQLGTNEEKTLHKFIKNELKTNVFPHLENDKWHFDSSIVLLDRNGHVRRAVVPQKQGGPPYIARFDFDQAADWDAQHVLTGTERNNLQELEKLMNDTIEILLKETDTPS